MDPEAHIGDNAELYAVGLLDDDEQAVVEAHVAHCATCLRRVGEAEETVLALEHGNAPARPQPLPLARASRNWWALPAIAAALIVGLLIPRPSSQQNSATLAMIHSHFSHAQFAGSTGVPSAKVLYARDRSWYYVIVQGAHRYQVYGIRSGQSSQLGTTRPDRDVSELFVRKGARYDRLELCDRGKPVETASIR